MYAQMGVIGKLVVVVLGIMSIVTLAITIERLITYARASKQSRAFATAVQDLLEKRQYAEARVAASKYEGSHIAPVIRSGLTEFLQVRDSGAGKDYNLRDALKSAIDRTSVRQ